MGDVKLIAAIALALGWFHWSMPLLAMFYAFALASIVIITGLIARKTKLKATIPLGPYLLAGFFVAATQMLI